MADQEKIHNQCFSEDPLTEPEKYHILSSLSDDVFELFDLCVDSLVDYGLIDSQMFKKTKA